MKVKAYGVRIAVLFILILFGGTFAQAEVLPPGMLIGDSEGINVDGTGEYYVHKEDLHPGEKFTKKIKMMNTEKNDCPYLLEMDIAPKENHMI